MQIEASMILLPSAAGYAKSMVLVEMSLENMSDRKQESDRSIVAKEQLHGIKDRR